MVEDKGFSPVYTGALATAPRPPETPVLTETDSRLEVFVLFTSAPATLAALKRAGMLASQLNARITLLVPQVVPYPLPLASPPVLVEFNARRFRVIAEQAGVETTVHIYLCRDALETVLRVLRQKSLVVVGGIKHWWPTPEKRMQWKLRRAGHEVLFVEMEPRRNG